MRIPTAFWAAAERLDDDELEHAIAQVRLVRAARRDARAEVRALHAATFGISTRRALEASESPRTALMRDYTRHGLTDHQIRQLMAAIPV